MCCSRGTTLSGCVPSAIRPLGFMSLTKDIPRRGDLVQKEANGDRAIPLYLQSPFDPETMGSPKLMGHGPMFKGSEGD